VGFDPLRQRGHSDGMNQSATTPPEKRPIDWEAIERDYRAGIKTLREIAHNHPGTNHVAITRRAKKEGWEKNLSARIQAKTEELVTKGAVTASVTKNPVTETQIVLENAAQAAAIRLGHRADIKRMRVIIAAQMEELEASSGPDQAQRLRDLGELMRSENENGSDKLNDIYRAVIGLPDRSRVAKQLAETLRIAIDLERREFGMDKTQVNTDPLTELIKRISTSNGSAFTPVAVDPAYSGGDE